jgi:hypothetical protein
MCTSRAGLSVPCVEPRIHAATICALIANSNIRATIPTPGSLKHRRLPMTRRPIDFGSTITCTTGPCAPPSHQRSILANY